MGAMNQLPKILMCAVLSLASAHAEFRTWARSDGKTAELELVQVTGTGDARTGEFRMRDGRKVKLAASVLSEADARLLAEWTAPAATIAAATTNGTPSVFDAVLDGNLVKLDGKSLKPVKDFRKPEKYYLFYYTASWCGPCQKFTPSLVEFYNKHQSGDTRFEVVLVSSDEDEDAMEQYARDKQMPWPQLKLSKAADFKKKFKHPGGGIPNLVLTDTAGNLIKLSYEGENYVGPSSVMKHLESLLR
jgi:thiol-disulfide isomerase/thioredoxin